MPADRVRWRIGLGGEQPTRPTGRAVRLRLPELALESAEVVGPRPRSHLSSSSNSSRRPRRARSLGPPRAQPGAPPHHRRPHPNHRACSRAHRQGPASTTSPARRTVRSLLARPASGGRGQLRRGCSPSRATGWPLLRLGHRRRLRRAAQAPQRSVDRANARPAAILPQCRRRRPDRLSSRRPAGSSGFSPARGASRPRRRGAHAVGAAARLGSVDLPFFLPELDRGKRAVDRVRSCVATARKTAASMAT